MSGGRSLNPFIRYLAGGGVSFAINFGLTVVLHQGFGVAPPVAYAVALTVSFIVNFLIARYFVFESSSGMAGQVLRFVATALAARAGEYLAFVLMLTVLGVHYMVSIIVVSVISIVLKFFVYRSFVFR